MWMCNSVECVPIFCRYPFESCIKLVNLVISQLAEFRSLLPDIHRPDKFARIVQLLGELRKNHLLIDRGFCALSLFWTLDSQILQER
jgi:hypothetical protein